MSQLNTEGSPPSSAPVPGAIDRNSDSRKARATGSKAIEVRSVGQPTFDVSPRPRLVDCRVIEPPPSTMVDATKGAAGHRMRPRPLHQGVVITSTASRLAILQNCLASFAGAAGYPILPLLLPGASDVDHLRWVMEHTLLDEFVFLHDSCELLDPALLPLVFEQLRGRSVAFTVSPLKFGTLIGKFRREVVGQIPIPPVRTAVEAALFELAFANAYNRLEPDAPLLDPPLATCQVFREKFGRRNMVLENRYLRKYKSRWTMEMAEASDQAAGQGCGERFVQGE
jgi:hypothetical protein